MIGLVKFLIILELSYHQLINVWLLFHLEHQNYSEEFMEIEEQRKKIEH